jgi:hypothetical protein
VSDPSIKGKTDRFATHLVDDAVGDAAEEGAVE